MGKATLVPNVQYKLEYEEDISLGGLKAQVLKHLESAVTENDQGSDTCSESLLTAIQIPEDQQLGDIGGTPGDKGTAADSSGSQTSTVPCSNSNDGSQTGLSKAPREAGNDGALGVTAVASTSGPQTDAASEAQSGDDFRLPLMPHIDFTQTESSERADSERSESFREEGNHGTPSASGCGNKGEDGDAAVTKEQEAFACTPARSCADTDGAVGEAGDGDPDGRSAVFQNVPTRDVVTADDACSDDGDNAFHNAPTQAYAPTEVPAGENEDGACSDGKEDAFRNAPTQAYAQSESAVEDSDDDGKDDVSHNALIQTFPGAEDLVEESDAEDGDRFDEKDYAFRNAETQGYARTEDLVRERDAVDGARSDGKDDSSRNSATRAYKEGTGLDSADDEHCGPDGETRTRVRDSETNGAMPIFTKNDEGKDAEEPSTAVPPRLGPSTNLSRLLFADTEPAGDSFVLCAASQSDGDQTDDEEDFCAPTQTDAGSATPKVRPVDLKRSTPVSVNETPPLSPKSAIEETPPSSPSIVPESDPEDADDSMVTARHSLSLLESTGTSLFQDCEEYGDSEVILPIVGRSDKRKALLSSLKRSGGKLAKEHGRTTHREASQLKPLEEEPDSVDGNLVGEQRSKQSGAAKKLEYADSTSSGLAILEEESTPGDVSRCKSASEGASFNIPGVAPLQLSSLVSLSEETAESNKVVLDSTFTVEGSNATADSSVLSAMAEDCRETAERALEEAGFQEADNKSRGSSGPTVLPNQSVDQTREKHESALDEEETQVSDVEDVKDTKRVSSGLEAEPAEPLRLSEEADVNESTLSEVAVEDAESEQVPKVPSLEATEDQTEATPLPFKLPKSPGRTKNADSEAADKVSKMTKKGSEKKVSSKKTETTKEVTLSLDVVQPPTRSRRSNAGARMKEFLSIEKRTAASGNFREDLASQEANKKEATPALKGQSNVEGGTSKQKKRGRKSTKEQMDEGIEAQELPSLPQPTEKLQLQPSASTVPESFSAANPAVEGKKTYQPFSRGIWDSQFQSTPYTSGTIDSCLSQAFPTFSQLMVGAGDDCRAADEMDEVAATGMDEQKKPPQQETKAPNVSMVVVDLDPKEVHPETIGSTRGSSGKMSKASSRSDTGPDRSENSLDAPVVQVMDAKVGQSKQRAANQDLEREEPQDLAVSEPLLEDAGCVPDSDETQDLDALIPAESTRPKWATRKSTPFVQVESAEDAGGSGDEFQYDSQTKKASGTKQVAAASRPSRNAVKPAPMATTSTVQDKQPSTQIKEALPARRRTRKQVLDVLVSESNDSPAVSEAGEKEPGDAIGDKEKSSRWLQSKRAASGDVEGPRSSRASHKVPRGKRGKNKAVSEIPDVTIPESDVAGSATEEVEDRKGTVRGKDGRPSSSLPGGISLQVEETASSGSRDSQPARSSRGRGRAQKVVDAPVSDVIKNDAEGFNEASAVDKDKVEPRSARLKGRMAPEAATRGSRLSQSSQSSQGHRRAQKAANAPVLDVSDAGTEESDEASAVDKKRDPTSSLSKRTTALPAEQAVRGALNLPKVIGESEKPGRRSKMPLLWTLTPPTPARRSPRRQAPPRRTRGILAFRGRSGRRRNVRRASYKAPNCRRSPGENRRKLHRLPTLRNPEKNKPTRGTERKAWKNSWTRASQQHFSRIAILGWSWFHLKKFSALDVHHEASRRQGRRRRSRWKVFVLRRPWKRPPRLVYAEARRMSRQNCQSPSSWEDGVRWLWWMLKRSHRRTMRKQKEWRRWHHLQNGGGEDQPRMLW
ncbi:unnamed protein product [Ixodes persulcatus]